MPDDSALAVAGLNHVTLAVSSLERSLNFYVSTLGCRLHMQWVQGAYLSSGSLWLCLSAGAVSVRTDYTHLAFTVEAEDIPAWRDRLVAAGVQQWKHNSSEGESIYILDPDAHRLELHAGNLDSRMRAVREVPYEGARFSD